MSIEYTLDIQLTELGFPDILQAQEAPEAPHSVSPSIKSLPAQHKQARQTDGRGTETGVVGRTSHAVGMSEVSRCEPVSPAQSLEDGPTATEAAVSDDNAGKKTTNARGGKDGSVEADKHYSAELQDEDEEDEEDEEDSDNSEVSEVYEEEDDVEEDCVIEEEEGLNTESSHPGGYSCSVCQLQLPSRFKLRDHMNLHTGSRPYCCAECGKRFCQTSSYMAHLRTHATPKAEKRHCRVCLKGFASESALNDHFSVNHLEKTFYECDLCKRIFTSRQDCEKHVQLLNCQTKFACDVCKREFSSRKLLEIHRKKFCHRRFKCTDCPEIFTKKNALLKHSFTHLGLLPYTCVRCRRHFRLAKLYCQHKCKPERIHCVACLREFSSHADFQQHKKDTGCWGLQERGAKTTEIRCLECGQRFDSTEELKKHAGAHQRVLRCAECWKGFRSALLLMSHMGGHAGKSPCLCQDCGLGFPYQQNYDSHLKTCGRTPPPVSATKKPQVWKSVLVEAQPKIMISKAPQSSPAVSTVTVLTPDLSKPPPPNLRAEVSKKTRLCPKRPAEAPDKTFISVKPVCVLSPAPQKGESAPAPLIAGVPASAASSDKFWKLSLDKPPPPSGDIVMLVPVCPAPNGELLLAPGIPPNLALPTIPALCQTSVSAAPTGGYFGVGVNPAFGMQPNNPMDRLPGNQEALDAPLDLSIKRTEKRQPAESPNGCVKSELEEMEVSEEAAVPQQHVPYHAGNMLVETNGDGCSKVKKWKIEEMVPSQLDVKTASYQKLIDIRPKPELSSEASEPAELTLEKKIKEEVDI